MFGVASECEHLFGARIPTKPVVSERFSGAMLGWLWASQEKKDFQMVKRDLKGNKSGIGNRWCVCVCLSLEAVLVLPSLHLSP